MLLLMHVIEEVQVPRETSAVEAGVGDDCQEESSAFPITAESSCFKQVSQGSETET